MTLVEIPSVEPSVLTIGTTWAWNKALGGFPASAGWQLTYYLRSRVDAGAGLTLAWGVRVTAEGDVFKVRVPASVSSAATHLVAGAHDLIGVVDLSVDSWTEQLPVVRVDLRPAPSATGSKSHALFMLETIEARMQGRSLSQEQRRVEINGRLIEYVTGEELRTEHAHWQLLVALEREPNARLQHAARFIGA